MKIDLSTVLIAIGTGALLISGLWAVFQYLINYASTMWIIGYIFVLFVIGGVIVKLFNRYNEKSNEKLPSK